MHMWQQLSSIFKLLVKKWWKVAHKNSKIRFIVFLYIIYVKCNFWVLCETGPGLLTNQNVYNILGDSVPEPIEILSATEAVMCWGSDSLKK